MAKSKISATQPKPIPLTEKVSKYLSDDEQIEEAIDNKDDNRLIQEELSLPAVDDQASQDTVTKVVKEVIDSTSTNEYKFINEHKTFDLVSLKEEMNNGFINKGSILHRAKCTKCSKAFVKSKREEYNAKIYTIFNNKLSILYCTEFLTCGLVICNFCICYAYKVQLIIRDSTKKDARPIGYQRQFRI